MIYNSGQDTGGGWGQQMKVYIVMICDIESIPVRQQLDTLWYSWEDAAERVRFVNGLYEKNGDGLHAYYHEGVVK